MRACTKTRMSRERYLSDVIKSFIVKIDINKLHTAVPLVTTMIPSKTMAVTRWGRDPNLISPSDCM